jgi:hypothetical protein
VDQSQRDIFGRFDGRNITWGLAESPLVVGDQVICTPGGKVVSMAALDRMTGETIWTCKGAGDRPGYASPIFVDYDGLKQIVTVMSESVVGVRASDGKLLWQYPHKVYADENITTPLFHDGYVIVSGCVRKGTTSLELQVTGNECSVEMHWHNRTLDNKQGGIVVHNGRLYGYAEMQARKGRGCASTSSPEKPSFRPPRWSPRTSTRTVASLTPTACSISMRTTATWFWRSRRTTALRLPAG